MDETLKQLYRNLFRGRGDVWGSVEGRCNKEEVTDEHYFRHLTGERSLGVYPLLNDGTCYFFAVDLDVKDFEKAKTIRDTVRSLGLNCYVAESKSKGYHVYGFLAQPAQAKDIRRILKHALKQLGMEKCEVFPKQDKLDERLPYGNYINLPCFGATRTFMTGDNRQVPTEVALPQVVPNAIENIRSALGKLPPEEPVKLAPRTERGHRRLPLIPPCIEKILEGVVEPGRDIAAFALARYFFEQLYTEEETYNQMLEWDRRNTPPLGDRVILEKVQSAEKGYSFGCSSITEDTYLTKFCIGKDDCPWLRQAQQYIIRDGKKATVDQDKLIKDLIDEYHFKTLVDTHEILVYQNGYWKYRGEEMIEYECKRRIPDSTLLTKHRVSEIIAHIQWSTYCERDTFNRQPHLINLENGIFNLRDNTLHPHSPEVLSTIRIPVEYDAAARCPAIEKFLSEVLRPENIDVILEMFGYCLIPDYRLQKAFLFLGDGANGKSTLLNVLKLFIGRYNCSNIPWQALESDKFAMAALDGKLVNIFADLPAQNINHTGNFKMLTGGDPIGADKKFKDRFSFENFARLVFSANKPPQIRDEDSFAFWRRWVLIDFPNEFTGGKDDKNLLQKLTTKQELSGLLNLALEHLRTLLSSGQYSYTGTEENVTEQYLTAADPVYGFLQAVCDSDPEGTVPKDTLYELFTRYCTTNKIPLKKPNSFARAVQNQTTIQVRSARQGGENNRVWKGIRLKREGVYDVVAETIDMEV